MASQKNETTSEQQVVLNEEKALSFLQTFLEQTQRGKAIKDLADAAKIHASLRYLQGKSVDPAFSIDKPLDALNVCLQALNLGQAAGVFSLSEAGNVLAVMVFLANLYEKKEKEASKGKGPAGEEDQ